MAPILRPSAAAFRKSGWIAASKADCDKYIRSLIVNIRDTAGQEPLLPPIQKFKEFIETDPTVYTEFIRMFEGATESPKNYKELLQMFNIIFREAPAFGSLGPPLYMIMAQTMNTQGGFSAYTKENLNYHFKKIFETWTTFLASKESRSSLTEEKGGWFSPDAKTAMLKEFSQGRLFEEVYICDPKAPYYGFNSFDDFFNRRFANPGIDRPTGPPVTIPVIGWDDHLISAACESTLYAYETNVKETTELFIKDEAYSLVHLLANDPSVKQFVGGTIIQGFLNTTGYHRWHVPVNGKITKIVNVPGTYFSQAPNTIGTPMPPPESDELPPYLKSLRYFANTAARSLVFIQANNDKIGLMCFIAIGMTEISTCEVTAFEGQCVKRGEELGMFHFGGSSSAMLFRPQSNVHFDKEYQTPGTPLKINEVIGAVSRS